ncbi:MAG TPA: IclR family transcriptional regulator [Syntrophorhabdaceae bacterium]|nr:IclR family transcriptional regulator [Syntrophorhabdaceae bacterium]
MPHKTPENLRYKTLTDFGKILTAFEAGGVGEKGVNEIARNIDILPSKASRMLKALEAERLFTRNPENGKYRISARFLQLGLLYVFQHPLREIILPHLEQAVRDLNMVTGWAIFENDQVTVVDRLNVGRKSFIRHVGSNVPLYSTAYGKTFLAYLPEKEIRRILAGLAFTRLTPRTITSTKRLAEEIKAVRKAGFALDRAETTEDITAVGAPILDRNGRITAVVTISTETSTVTQECLDTMARYVTERTAFISRQIGYDKHRLGALKI